MIVAVQVFDGISAAVLGVLVPLTVADLTRNTGRFNLVQGIIGMRDGHRRLDQHDASRATWPIASAPTLRFSFSTSSP